MRAIHCLDKNCARQPSHTSCPCAKERTWPPLKLGVFSIETVISPPFRILEKSIPSHEQVCLECVPHCLSNDPIIIKHQTTPTPTTQKPFAIQPNTNHIIFIFPPGSQKDTLGIATADSVLSTEIFSLVNPELELIQ